MFSIAFGSQKGGVGKSTLARAVAAAAVTSDPPMSVIIADLDPQQQTATKWARQRAEDPKLIPVLVHPCHTAKEALTLGDKAQLLILDGPARASKGTLEIASAVDLLIQPTGPSIDDLEPAIMVFHDLTAAGIPKERLVLVLCRCATKSEERDAREYIVEAGYHLLKASLPERASYRRAQNFGRAIIETPFAGPKARAKEIVEEIITRVATFS